MKGANTVERYHYIEGGAVPGDDLADVPNSLNRLIELVGIRYEGNGFESGKRIEESLSNVAKVLSKSRFSSIQADCANAIKYWITKPDPNLFGRDELLLFPLPNMAHHALGIAYVYDWKLDNDWLLQPIRLALGQVTNQTRELSVLQDQVTLFICGTGRPLSCPGMVAQ
jgi:hypothetical protein